jgi:hypothetical protein
LKLCRRQKLAPPGEGDHHNGNDECCRRDRRERAREIAIRDAEELPIIMFCGLPVMVAVLPALDAIASTAPACA